MKMQLALVLALTSFGMMPASAQTQNPGPAQEPHGPRRMGPPMGAIPGPLFHDFWKDSEVVAKLQLNEAQRSQLEKIFADHRESFSNTRQQFKAAEDGVRQALGTDPVNEIAYNANVAKLEDLHKQISQNFAAMALAFRKVLTLEQWKTLESLQQQHMEEFRPRHDQRFKDQEQTPSGK